MQLKIAKRSSSAKGKGATDEPSPSPRVLFTVDVPDDASVDDLKKAINRKSKSLYPDRQRLTVGEAKMVLEKDAGLTKYSIGDGDVVYLKDLGPQISWRTVFYIEYLGPMVRVYMLVMGHFLKRELETGFVHRFSHGTMPLFNVFKNSFHYHILSGLNLAYWVYGPSSAEGTVLAAKLGNPTLMAIFTGIFLFAELSNLSTHITLRNLRPPGTRVRRIPFGYGFDM
ncbi:3-oxo-5a-steroid 4- dehydrogenase, partial [Coemansia sp. RSA 1285]